ncbi:MAG: 1-deoxy-D-xylulose-5-phosphate reductoisomerase [Gammaproteobacteria bacterium]
MSASVAVLGATGSVGKNTLDVIRRHPDKYRVTALTANADHAGMRAHCAEFAPDCAVMAEPAAASQLARDLATAGAATRVHGGADALCEAAATADIVVCGIVGAAGLRSTLAAVRAGKKVLIANKEPLVMLGAQIMREARAHGAGIIPLDSEHNAIFQCLAHGGGNSGNGGINGGGLKQAGIAKVWLTGSGGPFRNLPQDEFANVTPAQARAHPTWAMGPKISVDSATMMNKGLELIEACALFALDADDVEIVVHPQSVIHSMVEYVDGSILAQLGSPDMRVPIAGALGWPQRIDSGARRLNLLECARFDFEAPDLARFPCIGLARAAARAGGVMPAAMNAANEIAVEAFLSGALSFDKIPRVVEGVMERTDAGRGCDLESALAADARARQLGGELAAAA